MSAEALHIPVTSVLTNTGALGQPMALRSSYYIVNLVSNKSLNPEYQQENIYFAQQTLEEAAVQIVEQNNQPDAILVRTDFDFKSPGNFRKLLQKNAIPFILYSPKFDKANKDIALGISADDYLFGSITPAFLNRIDFLKKLIQFKNNNSLHVGKNSEMPTPAMWDLKRPFDIFVSLVALLLLSPVLAIIALIVKMESKGPIFYISKRAGSGYKIFDFYKFRSMRMDADKELKDLLDQNQYGVTEADSVFFKIKNDPRVTRFGMFLRKTSLDEIPQLLNVLKGDMSLVGNRPLPLYEAEKLTKDKIVWRFLAPAGITGLWQITKRGKNNMSPEERIQLDMEYAMNNSFWFDLKIILFTFPALLQREKV